MNKSNQGSLTIALLTISTTFLIIITALLMLLTSQFSYSLREEASSQALNIAEAGINYYRWHLAHDKEDFQDGTGHSGPYLHDYYDPQGKKIGQFSLEIIPPQAGSNIVEVRSTGWYKEYPNLTRQVTAKFGRPAITQYSSLNNASLWFGSGITVHGRIHSNNGIRMDGVNTSLVTSGRETYTCGSETGCSPSETKPGVWGDGPNSDLWEFPVTAFDFDGMEINFGEMKTAAENEGLYLGDSGTQGYQLVFQGQQVSVYRVADTDYLYGYSAEDGCQQLYQEVDSQEKIGSYQLAETPIIFAEDTLWVSGIVQGRVSVVGAQFPLDVNNVDIWIEDNLVYQSHQGDNSLALIAQNDIYFTRDIPDDFNVDGALIAVNGHIIRHGYFWWCGGWHNAVRDSLTIYGSVISNLKPYWNYGTSPSSGFRTRTQTYDNKLFYNPPPYCPTSEEYQMIFWKEGRLSN